MIENLVNNLAKMLPFGYAFGAGMATAVSPCGIAMLPVYISLYLGVEQGNRPAGSPLRGILRALAMSGIVTLSFVVIFGIMGALLSAGGQFLLTFIPWITILIGAALILSGIFLVAGAHFYTSLPARLAARLGNSGGYGIKGFTIFGIAYAIAAMSCTLPIFLTVVASAITMRGFIYGIFQFVSYALGIGLIIVVVAIGSVLFRQTLSRWLRRLVPIVAALSGLLLVFAGAYIIYFWFSVGNILNLTF